MHNFSPWCRMFEIATQFNAIFRVQANARKISISLLSMWVSRRVRAFLSLLSVRLNQMENSASLRDAFDSCIFFSASMGRLGADFTSQLPPLFEKKMLSLVAGFWREGVNQLADTLKICRDAGVASPLSSSAIGSSGPLDGTGISTASPPPPPRQLLALPPLGRLVNAFLSGLNEIRRCMLPSIFPTLRESMLAALTEVEAILQANERSVLTPGLRGDAKELRELAKKMKEVMKAVVTPYLQGALENSLGNEEGAKKFHEEVIASSQVTLASMEPGDENEEVEGKDDNFESVNDCQAAKSESEAIRDSPDGKLAAADSEENGGAMLLDDEGLER